MFHPPLGGGGDLFLGGSFGTNLLENFLAMCLVVGFGTFNFDFTLSFLAFLILQGNVLGMFLLLPLGTIPTLLKFLDLQFGLLGLFLRRHVCILCGRRILFHFPTANDASPTTHSVSCGNPFTIDPNHSLFHSNEVNQSCAFHP